MHRRRLFTIFSLSIVLILPLLVAACGREQLKGAPDEPAAIDGDFRSDTPKRVAATGKPQLVEIYADW